MRALLLGIVIALAATAPAAAEPVITVRCNGTTCLTGWYRTAVVVDWEAAGGAVTGCQDVTRSMDTAGIVETCIVSPAGGGSLTREVLLKIDRTAPNVIATTPARPPDHDGWYTAPVTVAFSGADALSGLASCTVGSYAGGDSATARVTGTCTDVAGNRSAPFSFPLQYDATPPSTAGIVARPADELVALDLPAGASATIVRSPGLAGAGESRLASGATESFSDRRVRNGRRYEYRVTLTDQAGNSATRTLRVTPGPRLREPAAKALLAAPPLLRWTPVRGARYYNVQLKRDGKKILSRWPGAARLQLPETWRFKGRRHRLQPGRYRWVVWPGKGPRADGRYGKKIGARSFVMVAPPA